MDKQEHEIDFFDDNISESLAVYTLEVNPNKHQQ